MESACVSGEPSGGLAPGRTTAPSSRPTTRARRSATWTSGRRLALGAALLGGLALVAPSPARAQGDTTAVADPATVSRFNFDRLRFRGLGVAVGIVKPAPMVSTETYAIEADY